MRLKELIVKKQNNIILISIKSQEQKKNLKKSSRHTNRSCGNASRADTGRAAIRTEVTDRTTEVLMAMVRVRIRLDMEIRGMRTCVASMRVLMRDREAGV